MLTPEQKLVIKEAKADPKLASALAGVITTLKQYSAANLTTAKDALPAVPATDGAAQLRDQAVQVPFNGGFISVIVPATTVGESRSTQGKIAEGLGGRMGNRAENIAVAEYLIAQDVAGKLSQSEAILLATYRANWIRDSEGGLSVDGRRVYAYLYDNDTPNDGALVVLSLRNRINLIVEPWAIDPLPQEGLGTLILSL